MKPCCCKILSENGSTISTSPSRTAAISAPIVAMMDCLAKLSRMRASKSLLSATRYLHPIATPLPRLWLSFLVMPSSRSAAELKAPTTASDAALARSDDTTRASWSATSSSSMRRILWAASANSSDTIKAAITVRRVSPISPNFVRKSAMRASRSAASACKCSSCPSSQARRNWRPAMVALTVAMAGSLRLLVDVQHGPDRGDRRVEPLGDLAVGGFQLARARGLAVQRIGQPGAVETQRLYLGRQGLLAAIGLAPPLDGGIERVERQRQTFDRGIDRALLCHRRIAIAIIRT